MTFSFSLIAGARALLLGLLLSWLAPAAQAQRPRKKRRPARTSQKAKPRPRPKRGRGDFYRATAPKMRYVRPDTTTVLETEEMPAKQSDAAKSIFTPARPLSLVSEDTTRLNEGEPQLVEMAPEVLIDSTWVRVAGYYAIWDTYNINPYRVDGRRLRDTLRLHLVDPPRERFARMPLATTPITSGFAPRWGHFHYGVDLDLERGDTVRAAFDGVVRISKWDGQGYGNYLLVRHYNGLETLYGHLSKPLVAVGTFVKAGQPIGLGGSTGRSTGPHLHFEVRYEGNPINPIQLYDFPEYKLRSEDFTISSALFSYYNQALRRGGGRGYRTRIVALHRVRPGDTLSEIATRYGVRQSTLRRLNPGLRGRLQPGRKVRIR